MEVRRRLVVMVAGIALLYIWYFLGTAGELSHWRLLAIVTGGLFGTVLVLLEEADLDGGLEFGLSVLTGLFPSVVFGVHSNESVALFWLVAVLVLFATEARKAVEGGSAPDLWA